LSRIFSESYVLLSGFREHWCNWALRKPPDFMLKGHRKIVQRYNTNNGV
jgi:hypothetical protein